MRAPRVAVPVAVLGPAACSGPQSVLSPAGPQAERIASLWWFMLAIGAAVVLLVTVAVLAVALRRTPPEAAARAGEREARMTRLVTGLAALTVLVLLVTFVANVLAHRDLAALRRSDALTIDVTGHQWWWEVVYPDTSPQLGVTTANEIHVPVGRPVRLRLASSDVIHSLWIPNLHGKKDLVPGSVATHWLQADRPGVYRAQCAEFCGHQHAKMALVVAAEPPERFARWLEEQRRPAEPPRDPLALRGQEVFLATTCAMCHAIRGAPAFGRRAPDLTHLASRRTLAAGAVPNTRGHLAGWILDPQALKPGSRMPPTDLGPGDLRAVVAYLETLR